MRYEVVKKIWAILLPYFLLPINTENFITFMSFIWLIMKEGNGSLSNGYSNFHPPGHDSLLDDVCKELFRD